MIHNNYRAMNHVRQIVAEPLTPDRVFELHRILTDGTLDKPSAAGRFRHADEDVYVGDRSDGAILHTPPPAEELPERLERMCDFANGVEQKQFIHPVAHSILLHFWLAYDHPFVDGNGRTARALFYWAMLKHDYWLTEYLSISRILRKAPAKYSRSFLYTETDENDATYFVLSQMSVIRQAIHDLTAFLQKKASEIRATEALIRQSVHLNHRQLALLSHALKHPNTSYTIEGHGKSHGVVYQTARTDLLDLESKKLLVKTKTGKSFSFHVPSKLSERLRKL